MSESLQEFGRSLLDEVGNEELNDAARHRAVARVGADIQGWRLHLPSLTREPGDPRVLHLVADRDGDERQSTLLTFTRATDGEVQVREQSFLPADRESVRALAAKDPLFLPRPQKDLPAVAVGNRHPEIALPAVFDAFGRILGETGVNMASTVQLSATREMTIDEEIAARDGEDPTAIGHTRVSIEHLYHSGLWAAIRAGWRNGYSAEADHFIVNGATPEEVSRSIEATREAIRRASGYTKFTTDSSRLFELRADTRYPHAWTDAEVEQAFAGTLTRDERRWLLNEFAAPLRVEDREYRFSPSEVRRLAVKFGESLKLNEELYDFIREQKSGADFDFEPSIDEAATLTSPKELFFYMHWLRQRGRPASLVPPNLGFKKRQAYPEALGELKAYAAGKMWPELVPAVEGGFGGEPITELECRVRELAAVARHFDGTLSIHSGSGKQARVLEMIGNATAGRVNYKISGELQLQLLDVLSEQPEGSSWRELYRRMVDRCHEFASRNAFGVESALADVYRGKGLGYYLGDRGKGRVDGNLFLVFWIGNLVGTRDRDAPGGDIRFFKEKIDELPADLLGEIRRRNADYIVWLARRLQSR